MAAKHVARPFVSVLLGPVTLMASSLAAQETPREPLSPPEAPQSTAEPASAPRPPGIADLMLAAPSAVTFLDARTLFVSEVIDLRDLDRLASSLLTRSGPSEATGTSLHVRGVGTVAPNPGFWPSVDVRIDGVYRGRAGAALNDLGTLDRVDVHRGPEAGVAGRSSTAGLVDILTPAPDFSSIGRWNIVKGDAAAWRIGGDVTSPIKADKAAMRFDGWWESRNGQLSDLVSGGDLNDRARYLLRGQILWLPAGHLSVRLIGDYSRRREVCCAAVYLPIPPRAEPVAAALRANGAILVDDPARRETSVTPGRGFGSAVEDWGLSAETRWETGGGTFTALTAFRRWRAREGEDVDGNNLDLLARDLRASRASTISQDLRYEGRTGPWDWLVAGHLSREALDHVDDLAFGTDYTAYADRIVRLSDPAFPGFAAVADALGLAGATLDGSGLVEDRWRQTSTRASLLTHNILNLSSRLALTLGARYSLARTRLDGRLRGDNPLCGAIAATPSLAPLQALACAIPGFSADLATRRSDDGFTGTAILSWQPAPGMRLHAGYQSGWKPGAFTLDRLALDPLDPDPSTLGLAPERSESLELGARIGHEAARIGLTFFSTRFLNFQHAAFDGRRAVAAAIASCADPLAGGVCAPDRLRPAVGSRGLEAEASFAPLADLRFDLALTFADATFRDRLVDSSGGALPPILAGLAGQELPAAPRIVHTGRLFWTPPIGRTPLRFLLNLDWRFSSEYRSGDDLFAGATVPATVLLNGRAGVIGPDGRWSLELWSRNLTNAIILPASQAAPLQAFGDAALRQGWLERPLSYGFAMRTRF